MMVRNPALSRSVSVYLDAIRVVAATAVFLGHAVGFLGGLFWQLEPYQHEAVVIFFVLSGFLISYAVDRRERSGASYAVARAARMYSVVLLALVVTVACDAIGARGTPSLYSAFGPSWHVLSEVFFVNQIWAASLQPGSNGPFWTLDYEVWFYVVFGLFLFVRGPWRWPVALGATAIMGPWFAMLFPLWLAGVAAYRLTRLPLGRTWQWALCLLPVAAWLVYEASALHGHRWLNGPSITGRKMYWQDVLVAVCFSLHLVGLAMLTRGRPCRVPMPVVRAIQWCAGASFTMYLVHLPVMICLVAWMPWTRASWLSRAVILIGVPVAVLLLAELGERRKDAWRMAFQRILLGRQRHSGMSAAD